MLEFLGDLVLLASEDVRVVLAWKEQEDSLVMPEYLVLLDQLVLLETLEELAHQGQLVVPVTLDSQVLVLYTVYVTQRWVVCV